MANEDAPEEDASSSENMFEKLFRPPPYGSISALTEADAAGSLSDEDFDRHLGWFLGRLLPQSPSDCTSLPEPVVA